MLLAKTLQHIQTVFACLFKFPSLRVRRDELGISKIAFTAPRWHHATRIERIVTNTSSHPQIALDSSGRALVVWSTHDGISYNICSAQYVPGIGWSDAVELLKNNMAVVYCPKISMNARGHAVAVWSHYDGVRSSVWAICYAPNSGWGVATSIEVDTNQCDAETPQVDIDIHGNAIVVWRRYNHTQRSIWANRYEVGAGWLIPTLIDSNHFGDAESPQIAMQANGNAQAVWRRSNNVQADIWVNHYTLNMGWSIARCLSVGANCDAYEPQIAIDQGGSALAVWRQSDGMGHKVWFSRCTHDARWCESQTLEIDDAWQAFEPQIAVYRNGNAIAVWNKFNIGRSTVWASCYTPNVGWDDAQMISANSSSSNANKAQISISHNGAAMAILHQIDNESHRIYVNCYRPGVGWSDAVVLKSSLSGRADLPQVAMSESGDAIAVWQQLNGQHENIWASVYCQ